MPSSTLLEVSGVDERAVSAQAPDGARRRFAVNIASNVAYIAASTLVNLWFTPYLIAHLGVAAYGMVPLINSITSYMMLFTGGMDTAVSRFLIIDLNRGDGTAANRTFNSALVGLTGIALVLLPFGLAAAWFFPAVFQVPTGLENEVRLLFAFAVLAFLLVILSSSFSVSSTACHRFDLYSLVMGARLATRVGLVVILFKLFSGRLRYVGLGVLAASVVTLAGHWVWWRKLTPQLSIRPKASDRSRLRELVDMGGWAMVNQVGLLLLSNVDLMVVNAYLGAETTGEYGTVLLFSMLLTELASAGSQVLNPVVTARYALGEFAELRRLVAQAVKLMGLAVALPVGLLCGLARPLLGIWLGHDFEHLSLLLILLVGHLCVTLAVLPLRGVLTSFNKVRVQGIVTAALGVANVGLTIVMARWGGWGAAGVALATVTMWTLRNLVFVAGYGAHILDLPWWAFGPRLAPGVATTLVLGFAAYGLTRVWWPENWFELGGIAVALSLGYAAMAYLVCLNRDDRELVASMIREPLARLR